MTASWAAAPSNPGDTQVQEPSIHALSIADGSVLWERTQNHSAAPTSVADGVVFSGLIGFPSGGGDHATDFQAFRDDGRA